MKAEPPPPSIGVVVIGRNEGLRLQACLRSIVGQVRNVVYVDSDSTDQSVAFAQSLGIDTIQMDHDAPFTAARARNRGFQRLIQQTPGLEFVQFIDGDCQVIDGWLDTAAKTLTQDTRLAVVSGRCRERFPDASVYNRHCDMEWDTPVGQAKACGGNAMMRIKAFQEVGRFDHTLICGEEPELCIRLRQAGWNLYRIDAEMVLHDAEMIKFSQFWKRSVRSGWSYAQGTAMHGKPPERHCVRQSRNIWFYGAILPIGVLGSAWPTYGFSLMLGAAVILRHVLKVRGDRIRHGDDKAHALAYARLATIAKFPEALGQAKYWLTRLRGRQATLIEYKSKGGNTHAGET